MTKRVSKEDTLARLPALLSKLRRTHCAFLLKSESMQFIFPRYMPTDMRMDDFEDPVLQ